MRASIIIVTYNSRVYLEQCIDSILSNIGPQDELIMVDNDSTDDSVEFVHSRYPHVRLIQSANRGYAGGNNRGAADLPSSSVSIGQAPTAAWFQQLWVA